MTVEDITVTPDDVPSGSFQVSGVTIDNGGEGEGKISTTSYWCKGINVTHLDGSPQHAVGFEPIVTEGNERRVHHILLYQCPDMANDPEAATYSGNCWADSTPRTVKQCNFGSVVTAWAIGGEPSYFPTAAGMKVGEGGVGGGYYMMEVRAWYLCIYISDGTRLFARRLSHTHNFAHPSRGSLRSPSLRSPQIHYDNYDASTFNDSSGLRMLYTPTLRENDIGVMYTGALIGIDIPPNEERYDINARYGTSTYFGWHSRSPPLSHNFAHPSRGSLRSLQVSVDLHRQRSQCRNQSLQLPPSRSHRRRRREDLSV